MSWTLRLTAAALAAACWLAAPAGAAGLLGGGEQAPAVPGVVAEPVIHVPSAGAALKEAVPSSAEPAASVRRRVAAARTAAGAPVGGAAKNAEAANTVAAARSALDAAVRGRAETVSGAGPAVREAAETASALGAGARGAGETASALGSGARPKNTGRRAADIAGGATDGGGPTASDAGRAGPLHDGRSPGSAAIAAAAQLARLQAASHDASVLPHPAFLDAFRAAAQALHTAAPELAGGASRPGGAAKAAPARASGPALLQTAGGGSPFSSAAASFSLGGLAILLVALFLAGPALRRRLPGRRVTAWPAAFVPLLERPG